VRKGDRNNLCAKAPPDVQRGLHCVDDLRLHATHQVLGGNADPHAAHVPSEGGHIIGDGQIGRSGVEGIVAGDGVQHKRGVTHIARQGADLVQRRGKGHQAIP